MSPDLLTIDVAAELKTLCEAQLRGSWQVPAELVRLALRLGAGEVSVERRVGFFEFRWYGASIGEPVLRSLAVALDRETSSGGRHQAIVEIERLGAEALLWAAGIRGAKIRIEDAAGDRCLVFRARDGGRAAVTERTAKSGGDAVVISWRCSRLNRRRAESWLIEALRHNDRRVRLNGDEVPRGFADGLYLIEIQEPLPCRIALTRSGEEPVLWLLKDGVVAARAGVPGFPPFQAAIEMQGEVSGGASSADLRRAVEPYLLEIVDRAVWMMIEIADRWQDLDHATRQRLAVLLLRSLQRGLRSDQIRKTKMIPTKDGPPLSLDEIEGIARRRGGVIPTVDASDGSAGSVSRSALLLSTEARALLAEQTGVRFETPRGRRYGWHERLRDARRRAILTFSRRLRGLFGARPLSLDNLSAREQRMVSLLQSAVEPAAVAARDGSGDVAIGAGGYLLGRDDPLVIQAVKVLAQQPSWLYPVLLALEVDGDPGEPREKWLRAFGSAD